MRKSFFFDTSALVKLYHEEDGTEELTLLVSSENPVILISDITVIEMISALAKKVRTEEDEETDFDGFIQAKGKPLFFSFFMKHLPQSHNILLDWQSAFPILIQKEHCRPKLMKSLEINGLSRFDRINPMNLPIPDATAGFLQRSIR